MLGKLVEDFVEGRGSSAVDRGPVDQLLAFVQDVGTYRMGNCRHAEKGQKTGELICWLWHFYEGEESMDSLELIPITGKGGEVKYHHAVVNPVICGASHAYERGGEK